MLKKLLVTGVSFLVIVVVLFIAVWQGWLAEHEGPGTITEIRVPEAVIEARVAKQAETVSAIGKDPSKQVLFGDLHVHTTLSFDAFLGSLPMMNGEGTHPIGCL